MKNLVYTLLLLLVDMTSRSQSPEQVLNHFYAAINNLDNLSYRINNIDTFLTGEVWNTTGRCKLKRDKTEPLFGFLFQGKRDDADSETIFNGTEIFYVNRKEKKYEIDREQVNRGVLGSPGGQMVLAELILPDKDYNRFTIAENASNYLLKFEYPDNKEFDITKRYKEIHVDKSSYLPIYRFHSLESLGEKQVSISILSEVRINDPDFIDPFMDKEFLVDYEYLPPKKLENKSTTLIGKAAPDFELTDVNGKREKLSSQREKIILLDFWEIWCGPCIESIPKINDLIARYPPDKFVVWSVVSDSKTFTKLKLFIEKRAIPFRVFFGSPEVGSGYFLEQVPQYVLIGKGGKVEYSHVGYSDEIHIVITNLLAK